MKEITKNLKTLITQVVEKDQHQYLNTIMTSIFPLHSAMEILELENHIVSESAKSISSELAAIVESIRKKHGGISPEASYKIISEHIKLALLQGDERSRSLLESDFLENHLKEFKPNIADLIVSIINAGHRGRHDENHIFANNLISRALDSCGENLSKEQHELNDWDNIKADWVEFQNKKRILKYSEKTCRASNKVIYQDFSRYFFDTKQNNTHGMLGKTDIISILPGQKLSANEIPEIVEGMQVNDTGLIADIIDDRSVPDWAFIPVLIENNSKHHAVFYDAVDANLSGKESWFRRTIEEPQKICTYHILEEDAFYGFNRKDGFSLCALNVGDARDLVSSGGMRIVPSKTNSINFGSRFFFPEFSPDPCVIRKYISIQKVIEIALMQSKESFDHENKKMLGVIKRWISMLQREYKKPTSHYSIEDISLKELMLASHVGMKLSHSPAFIYSENAISELSRLDKNVISQYELYSFSPSYVSSIGQSGFNALADMGLTHVSKDKCPKTPEAALKFAAKKGGDQPHHIATLRLFDFDNYKEMGLKSEQWDLLYYAFPEHSAAIARNATPDIKHKVISSDFEL